MHSVVVSRFLRKEKASGSNPDVSIIIYFFTYADDLFVLFEGKNHLLKNNNEKNHNLDGYSIIDEYK